MPWHIETANPDCRSGYAVVKDETGEVEGCHRTRREALAQLAALNIAEERKVSEERQEGYAPTDGMVAEARRGLEWRQAFGRGGTQVGVARARDIVNRRRLSRTTVVRMASYFARHAIDKRAQGFRPGEPGYPSAGRIAWALWGGDAGETFARSIIASSRSLTEDTEAR
jgi:hypothetical protein